MDKKADIFYARLEKKRFLRKAKPIAHIISDDKQKFALTIDHLKRKNKKSRLAKLEGKSKIIQVKTKNKKEDAAIIAKLLKRDKSLSKGDFQKKNKFHFYDKKQTEKVAHDIIMESFLNELKTISKLSQYKSASSQSRKKAEPPKISTWRKKKKRKYKIPKMHTKDAS